MREIIAITHVTLDGVMQAPGGPEEDPRDGFEHGGWAMALNDEASGKEIAATIAGEFALLLGRRTYDIFAGYWPNHGDNPIGKAFNAATKFVVTRHPAGKPAWAKSQYITGDAVAVLRELKRSDGPVLHVWGSGQLLQTLMAADLVDEHRLWVLPIMLGNGRRLFDTGLPRRNYSLVSARSTPGGTLMNHYRPVR